MGHSQRLLQVAVIVFSLGLGVAEGQAAVLRVPQDYATIQAAINAVATGDTVLVSQGTYAGGLVISRKTITLASTSTPATPTTLLKSSSPAAIL